MDGFKIYTRGILTGHDNELDLGENEETVVKNSLYLFDMATSWLIIRHLVAWRNPGERAFLVELRGGDEEFNCENN